MVTSIKLKFKSELKIRDSHEANWKCIWER